MDIEAEAVQCDDVPVTLDESAASESVHSENDFTSRRLRRLGGPMWFHHRPSESAVIAGGYSQE